MEVLNRGRSKICFPSCLGKSYGKTCTSSMKIDIKEKPMRSLKELMNLDGRVALITGGAGHIGSSMGEALAELGAKTIVLDSTEAACNSISDRIRHLYNVESFPLVVNLLDEKEIQSIPDTILNRFGKLDILI